MMFTGMSAIAKMANIRSVSSQSIENMTKKVKMIVKIPVMPPSTEDTALPTSPMSEEKREARPAGASVWSLARSVATSRANIVLRSAVSIRFTAWLAVVSLKYCAVALTEVSAMIAAGAHQTVPAAPLSKPCITCWISLA